MKMSRYESRPTSIEAGKKAEQLSVSFGRNAYGCSLIHGGVEMKRKVYYLLLAVGLVILSLFLMVGLLAAYPIFSMIGYIGIAIMMLTLHFSDKH